LLNLDIGLPVERLKPVLRTCLTGDAPFQEVAMDAINRRGKPIVCRVTCTPMTGGDGITGIILMMEDESEPSGIEAEPVSLSGDGKPGERPPAPQAPPATSDGDGSATDVGQEEHRSAQPSDPD
jgi:hypothetical protein